MQSCMYELGVQAFSHSTDHVVNNTAISIIYIPIPISHPYLHNTTDHHTINTPHSHPNLPRPVVQPSRTLLLSKQRIQIRRPVTPPHLNRLPLPSPNINPQLPPPLPIRQPNVDTRTPTSPLHAELLEARRARVLQKWHGHFAGRGGEAGAALDLAQDGGVFLFGELVVSMYSKRGMRNGGGEAYGGSWLLLCRSRGRGRGVLLGRHF